MEEEASADATHKATSNVYTVVHRTDGLKTIAKRVHNVSQLLSFKMRHTTLKRCTLSLLSVLKEAGVKSTATPAQLTVYDKMFETFARTKLSDDLDDFPRSRHHEIEFRGVSRIFQLA